MRQRFIQSFSTSGTEHEAIDAELLGKPYVAYIEDGRYIDWNTLWPTPPEPEYSAIPLTFKIISGGTIVWSTPTLSMQKTIQYSKNGGELLSITSNTGNTAPAISVDAGDILELWGNNTTYGYYGYTNYHNSFSASTALFNAKGNIMSLLYGDNFVGQTQLPSTQDGGTFRNIFKNCSGLMSIENLVLPAQNLLPKCYEGMFSDCVNIEKGPIILIDELNLAAACSDMFRNCSKLSYIKCLATVVNSNTTTTWLAGVSPTGTFVKHPDATWTRIGSNGIPPDWTVIDAQL